MKAFREEPQWLLSYTLHCSWACAHFQVKRQAGLKPIHPSAQPEFKCFAQSSTQLDLILEVKEKLGFGGLSGQWQSESDSMPTPVRAPLNMHGARQAAGRERTM